MNETDIGLLAARDVKVAHNPVANMILASGVCPVPRLRREGVTVGIGTDGAASNDSNNMLEAVKMAALVQKLHHLDATRMSASDALRMATIDGAGCRGARPRDPARSSRSARRPTSSGMSRRGLPGRLVTETNVPYERERVLLRYAARSAEVLGGPVPAAHRVADGELVGADLRRLVLELDPPPPWSW